MRFDCEHSSNYYSDEELVKLSGALESALNNKIKYIGWFALTALLAISVSQLIGYWINTHIALNATLELNSFVHITHVRNFGGVFGLLQGLGWVFALVSIGLLVAVACYLWFAESVRPYEYICFGFIVGGGASNILDRFIYGSVIDFIDVQHIPFWNYIFNTADVMVHIGIWPLLFFSFLKEPQNKSAAS